MFRCRPHTMAPHTRDTADGRLTLDEVFSALSHSTRRHVLSTIAEHDPRRGGEMDPEDLLEGDETPQHRHLELHHNHLPSLDAAGFIDWDPETDTITRGPRYEDIRPVIELMRTHQDELPDDWP